MVGLKGMVSELFWLVGWFGFVWFGRLVGLVWFGLVGWSGG